MQTFEPGLTYSIRSICDHEHIVSVTIASRTAKTVKTTAGETFRIASYDGAEFIRPWGNYSMAPIISATERALTLAEAA